MTQARLPAFLEFGGKKVLLKYHKLLGGTAGCPPNSLSALQEVLAGGAQVIEFDVNYLNDVDFVLNHDNTLERETTHEGPVRELKRADVKDVRIRGSDERLALLSEAVDILQDVDQPVKLQIDFKEKAPLSVEDGIRFLKAIEPIREHPHLRIVVGSLADWNLRALRRLDEELEVGLDFLAHLDAGDVSDTKLPTRLNVYGYLDDHPLGFHGGWPVETYLRDRVETLIFLIPGAVEFYLRDTFVMQSLVDGFNPVEFVHEHLPGSHVDVWTINHGQPGAEQRLRAALEAGADQITTNTASVWARTLADSPIGVR